MSAATRGVVLAVAAVVLGAFILGQGFSDAPTLEAVSTAPGDDGGTEPSDDGTAPADDGAAPDDGGAETGDDGAASDDAAAGDDSAASDDSGGEAGDDEAAADDGGDDDAAAPDDGGGDGEDVPDILHPANEVRVLVANGTSVSGAAGRANDSLVSDRGYGGLTPTNTTAPADASAIYYQSGYELDARQIAQILDVAPDAVAPMPDDPPVDDLLEAHVLVVIGPDFPGLQ